MRERINPLDLPEQFIRVTAHYHPPGARYHVMVYNNLERKVEVYPTVKDLTPHHEEIREYSEGDEVGTSSSGYVYRHTDSPTDTSYCGIPCVPINEYVGIPGNGTKNWRKWQR